MFDGTAKDGTAPEYSLRPLSLVGRSRGAWMVSTDRTAHNASHARAESTTAASRHRARVGSYPSIRCIRESVPDPRRDGAVLSSGGVVGQSHDSDRARSVL